MVEEAEEDMVALSILFALLLAVGGKSGNLDDSRGPIVSTISPKTYKQNVMKRREEPTLRFVSTSALHTQAIPKVIV